MSGRYYVDVGREGYPSRSGLEVPGAIGAIASSGVGIETRPPIDTVLEANIAEFLNPDIEKSATEQLTIMRESWAALGHEMPELGGEKTTKIEETLAANPGKRVVPTPLLDLDGRKKLCEVAQSVFPKCSLDERLDPLQVPEDLFIHRGLLYDLNGTIEWFGMMYRLGYKLPNDKGVVVGRSAWEKALVEVGHAVESPDGIWTFSVMDVLEQIPHGYDPAGEMYETVDPSITSESLIARRLLCNAAGLPGKDWHFEFANEAVYKIDSSGKPIKLASVISVGGGEISKGKIDLSIWSSDSRRAGFCVRPGVSGL